MTSFCMLRQSFTGLKMEKVRVSADRARAASSKRGRAEDSNPDSGRK
jgi:hypothetical protein